MSWGEIDIIWTIIFIIIISAILYWAYTIYTGNRPYITQTTFIPPNIVNNNTIMGNSNDDYEDNSDDDTGDDSDDSV